MISVLSRISCKGNNTGAASSLVGVNGNEPSRGSCCRYKDNRLILIMNKLQEFFGSSHDRMGDFRGQGKGFREPDCRRHGKRSFDFWIWQIYIRALLTTLLLESIMAELQETETHNLM
ncbi:predicted protein [Arabidopsis lyrata subsp. lyrata]|uniref:Predicted protein n=1 Tax=Arabidopsis lyrata subsp. lyrata TaxID=81972 RepID=D7MGG7_ARALL|nr:predicted protein [Arabidopsis lyrata subsp. lyrata]